MGLKATWQEIIKNLKTDMAELRLQQRGKHDLQKSIRFFQALTEFFEAISASQDMLCPEYDAFFLQLDSAREKFSLELTRAGQGEWEPYNFVVMHANQLNRTKEILCDNELQVPESKIRLLREKFKAIEKILNVDFKISLDDHIQR